MASEKDLSIEDDDHVIIFADSRQQVPEIEKTLCSICGILLRRAADASYSPFNAPAGP